VSPGPLAGQIALVTGASRGIGRGVALGLGEAGATVYMTGRTIGAAAADEVSDAGGVGVAIPCDHRDDGAVAGVFGRIAAEAGRLDVLVNNATAIPANLHEIFGAHAFWDLPVSLWDDLFDVGVRSYFVAAQHAARAMVQQGRGLIVNISSGAAQAKAGVLPYAVGKAAVDRMTADMAQELEQHGVAVLSLWPPPSSTDGMLAVAQGDAASKWSEPVFTGRIVAALAAGSDLLERSGKAFRARELGDELGIADQLYSA
jgi:dehydrogenase/reductase SDR family member 1